METKNETTSACSLLSDLPSRGLFSSPPSLPPSTLGSMRVYICDHDTSPPDHQLIKTDQMNILIRSLLLKKRSADAPPASRKRAAEKSADSASGKRPATGDEGLQCFTVERLRGMLREKGLNVKGKKDELIARLRGVNG